MRKTYKGTNADPIKIWGVPFKANDIVEVEVVNEPHTISWSNPIEGLVYEKTMQVQQLNIHTRDGKNDESIAVWGYSHGDSKEYIKMMKENFEGVVKYVVSRLS